MFELRKLIEKSGLSYFVHPGQNPIYGPQEIEQEHQTVKQKC